MTDEYYSDPSLDNVCNQLWDMDDNRLAPEADFSLDLQGRTRFSYDGPDQARDPLFTHVKPSVFNKPTFKAFVSLLDNYERAAATAETETSQEESEKWRFINLCMATRVMQTAHKFLKFKGKVGSDTDEFKQLLCDMWFKLYRRTRESRNKDSCGFESSFVASTRGNEVVGTMNWIQLYLQEKAGHVNYKGFMASDKNPHLLTIQYSWKAEVQPKTSLLIGTSPELELALYTICFLMGHEKYKVQMAGAVIMVNCHATAGKIGRVYVTQPPMTRRT